MNDKSREALLPCPFCGSCVLESRYISYKGLGYKSSITCATKQCHGNIYAVAEGNFDSIEEAVKAWNKRPQQHQEPREVAFHGVCSNKPRPSVQNNHSKGNQYWAKDVWHIRKSGAQTMCGIDSSEWLDMGELTADLNLCDRCKKITLQPKPSTEVAGDVVERVALTMINRRRTIKNGLEPLVSINDLAESKRMPFIFDAESAIAALSRSEVKQSDGWLPEPEKPKTKEAFAAMLMRDYGYDRKLAEGCASDVAGYGAFEPAPAVQSEGEK